MKFLLVAFLVTIVGLAAIAAPHHHHNNGTSHAHQHHPEGQWNGTDAGAAPGQDNNRTFVNLFRHPTKIVIIIR
uniref:Putative hhh secreted protein n=1 Tax=Psorophora albipes TaxID=869069 RepID=T1D5X4_9DIPT